MNMYVKQGHEQVLIDVIWPWAGIWEDFFIGTGCSGTTAQRCHMRLYLHHLSLLTLCITFLKGVWRWSFHF